MVKLECLCQKLIFSEQSPYSVQNRQEGHVGQRWSEWFVHRGEQLGNKGPWMDSQECSHLLVIFEPTCINNIWYVYLFLFEGLK